ncbi:enoyl-CoA hydratase/isomerase family protein [Mesorhizobium sp. A556]
MSDHLDIEVVDGIATITMNRPEKLNSFTHDMLVKWVDRIVETGRREDVRVAILTGAGRAFSTGGDIQGFAAVAQSTPAEIKAEVAQVQKLTRALTEFEKPIIAAINGFATGGGLDLALACDIRFAAQSAKMAETYARMGLVPGAGGAYLLPRLIGNARALEMLWSTEPVSGEEAERIGLVNHVYPDEELMARTQDFARKIAAAAPLSVQIIKKMVRLGADKDLATGLELAASGLAVVRKSQDHLEAVAAFKEKRTPVFHGK